MRRFTTVAAEGAADAAPRFLAAWLRREAMALDPACFSLVMATCIVSNSFFLQGYPIPSDALLAVGLVAYTWLCLLTAWRATRAGAGLWADLLSPRSVFSFFTFVAAVATPLTIFATPNARARPAAAAATAVADSFFGEFRSRLEPAGRGTGTSPTPIR